MTDPERLASVYVPHIRDQFSLGRVVLFTGAGFSLGAGNIGGTRVATVQDLRRLIWTICYPSETFDESASLQDLFEEARISHRKDLVNALTRALTVDHRTIPDWYTTIFSMPWLCGYTLNIDDLADAVARHARLPRAIRSRSALTDNESGSFARRADKLDIVHLNGALAGLPDNVTFSSTQYAQRIAERDPAYMRFVSDLLTRCVIFIGTSLDESPLWQHIELRGGRGDRGMGELRPRSYLVTPTLSRPRESLLSRFNIVWLQMTAQQFADDLLSQMTGAVAAGFLNLNVLAEEQRANASEPVDLGQLRPDPTQRTDFLLGQEPSWSDLVSGRAADRDVDGQIWEAIQGTAASKEARSPVAIIGNAGSGKSTSLMRAALKLSGEGKKVAWIDRGLEISTGSIVDLAYRKDAPDVIAIDDADRYGPHLSMMLRDCVTADSHPLVLLEMRSQHVDRCINTEQLRAAPIIEITMPPLSDRDIDAIILSLDRENRLGRLKGMSRDQRRRAFRDSADRDLLVALYEATTGLRFRQRVLDELQELSHPANVIYAIVAVATSRRFDLSRDEILLAAGDSSNETLNEVDRLARRGMLVPARSAPDRYSCRHKRIGELLLDEIRNYGFMQRVITGLITAGAAKAHTDLSRSARPFRIVKTFVNHEFLHEVLDTQQARDVYADCEALLHWDHHYWLHRGSFEVEWGDLELAENFLAQAQALMPGDALVRNEWAYLLFKKAVRNAGLIESREWAAEAYDILTALTYDQVPRAHPFHVLGHQGLAWAEVGIEDDEERSKYLFDLRGHMRRGRQLFPGSTHIRNASASVEDAYLRLAVQRK